MFCPGCGNQMADDAAFCSKCGTRFGDANRAPRHAAAPMPAQASAPVVQQQTAKKSKLPVIIIAVLVVLAAAGGAAYFLLGGNGSAGQEQVGASLSSNELSSSTEAASSSASAAAEQSSSGAAEQGGAQSARSGASLGTLKLSDLKLEVKEPSKDGEPYEYTLSGKMTNTDENPVARATTKISFSKHVEDKYGDDQLEDFDKVKYSDELDREYFGVGSLTSVTPKVIRDTFLDMKPNEEREFTYVFTAKERFSDPKMEILDTYGDPSDSVEGYWTYGKQMMASYPDEFSARIEAHADNAPIVFVTNNAEAAVSTMLIRYRFTDEHGMPNVEVLKAEDVRPGSTFEIPGITHGKAVGASDPEILDICANYYQVLAADNIDEKLEDVFEWSVELRENGGSEHLVLVITNNTGKYLNSAEAKYVYNGLNGREEAKVTFRNLKPGETYEERISGKKTDEITVNDISYIEDKDKASE